MMLAMDRPTRSLLMAGADTWISAVVQLRPVFGKTIGGVRICRRIM